MSHAYFNSTGLLSCYFLLWTHVLVVGILNSVPVQYNLGSAYKIVPPCSDAVISYQLIMDSDREEWGALSEPIWCLSPQAIGSYGMLLSRACCNERNRSGNRIRLDGSQERQQGGGRMNPEVLDAAVRQPGLSHRSWGVGWLERAWQDENSTHMEAEGRDPHCSDLTTRQPCMRITGLGVWRSRFKAWLHC